jgi:7-cyano-7-deazaguanine synthase
VLFSGGQDSTTCLFWAKEHFETVEALSLTYGQRHIVEIEQARKIAAMAEVELHERNLTGLLGGSALTEQGDTNAPHALDESLPASFVPGRNALFLALAASLAYTRGIHDIVGGMCEADYSGYPDCRLDFVRSMQESMTHALGKDVRIHTPLMRLTKAETWRLASDLGCLETVVEHSHTDYHGDRTQRHDWGYGKLDNPASILRAKGFEEARQKGWV